MDRLPDRTDGRKRDSRSAASSPSPPPSRFGAHTTRNPEEPTNKRIRRDEPSRDTTAGPHNGHTFSHGTAMDQAEVQYGDRHNHVYNYNGCPSKPCDRLSSRQEGEQDGPYDVAQALEDLAFAQMEERRDTISKSYSNTCEWLFQKHEYLNWRDPAKMSEHYGFFWIKSKPGAGKSTLMKFFFKSAKKQLPKDNVISFFFNARGETLEKSLEGLYRSLLYQLLTQIPRLQHHLRTAGNSTSRYQNWSLESLKSVFAEAAMHLEQDRLTCLIDALDECPEVEIREMIDFFEELGELAADKGVELRVCFSSRHYPQVTMKKCQDMLLDGQTGHEEDIKKYVESKLKTGKGKTEDGLRQAVQVKAQGVFMWVVLVVRILNEESDRGSNNARLWKCLDQIPSKLHELFEDILKRGIRDDENLVPILQWISFAQRPLACEELYFAVRSDRPDFDVAKPWNQDEDDTETMKLFILNSSKGLAELTRGKKPTVQFIHESVRDYLRETGFRVLAPDLQDSLLGSTHDYLKRCCLRWMSDHVIKQLSLPRYLLHMRAKSLEAKELREKASTNFPFLEYSVKYLVQHAELAYSHGISQIGFVETFPQFQLVTINNVLAVHNTRRYEPPYDTTTYIFTDKGASRLLGFHLAQNPSSNQWLLGTGITNGKAPRGRHALTVYDFVNHAIGKRDAMTLKVILSHSTHDIDIRRNHLERAYRTMNMELVQVLLSWHALDTSNQWEALYSAIISCRHDEDPVLLQFLKTQLRALIGNVAEANLMFDELVSWLENHYSRPIVEVIVETDLASFAGSHTRRSAMVSACVQGLSNMVRWLLDQGYRLDAMDSASYFEALSGAARNGHADTLIFFLAHDPDIELQEADSYREVVQVVTMGRFSKVLEILLDRSRGFRMQDRATYRGPLRQATQLGFHEIVQILRERGVTLPEDEAT